MFLLAALSSSHIALAQEEYLGGNEPPVTAGETAAAVGNLEYDMYSDQVDPVTQPIVTEVANNLGWQAATPADEAKIREVVEKYLAEREKKAKDKEEAEEKEKEAEGYAVGSDLSMTASWNNGLELSTKNKDFRVHVGGRTQFDASWFDTINNVQNNINIPFQDGVDFRRARLRVDGTFYETMEWAAEYDFVNAVRAGNAANTGFVDQTVVAFTDLWWQFKTVPLVENVRIGNQKEPIGFEHLVSSRFLPFMERSFNQDVFYGGTYNGFTPGIQCFDTIMDERGTYAFGLFKPVNNVFSYANGDGDYSLVGRMTVLPWYVEHGRGLLHLGVSGKQSTAVSNAGIPGRQMRFRTRGPERAGIAANWPILADINLFGDDMQTANAELVGVYGPWTLQGEYLVNGLQDARTSFGAAPVGSVTYHGGYIQVLRFLTGENDNYNVKNGFFDRVKPNENFFLVGGRDAVNSGMGAWQLGARYNYLDLNDQNLNGGILHDITMGLNWFWNPNMKWQFNFSSTYRDAPLVRDLGDGWIYGWGMRFAHDF